MTREIPQRVTCEVCGTSYDPRESRGWCPNPACGKWQHPDFPLSAGGQGGQQEAADGGVQAPTKICPGCGKEIRADANFCKFCSYEFPAQETDGDDGGEPEQDGLDQCPTCDADLSSIPAERLDDCPICGRDLEDLVADRGEPDISPADLEACPACHADLTDIPSDMRRICPECRVSLEEAIAEHGVGGAGGATGEAAAGAVAADERPDQGTQGAAGAGGAGAAEAGAGAAEAGAGAAEAGAGTADNGGAAGTPGGGADPAAAADHVDTIKGIGSSYASRLGEQGVETVGDLLRADPATLSVATDISEKRLGEWVEKAPIDADDLGGTPAESGGEGTAGEPATQGQGQPPDAGTGKASGGGGGQGAGGQPGTGAGAQGGQGRQGRGQGGGQQPQGHRRQQGGAGQGTGSGQASGGNGRGGRSQGRSQAGASGRGQADQGRAQGGGGRNAGAGREGAGARRRYDTLVFEVEGKEIRASPGDTVGREIRTAMVESGAPKEDAVYVHREHLRVERDQGTFYLVRLGQNNLKVNGEPVDQHGRMPVESGDNVSFSEVVSGTIRLE